MTVSINVTERQFRDERLLRVVQDALAATGLAAVAAACGLRIAAIGTGL